MGGDRYFSLYPLLQGVSNVTQVSLTMHYLLLHHYPEMTLRAKFATEPPQTEQSQQNIWQPLSSGSESRKAVSVTQSRRASYRSFAGRPPSHGQGSSPAGQA